MSDVDKIRGWLGTQLTAMELFAEYSTKWDAYKLFAICRMLLDACEKQARWEAYFYQTGKMYDPSLGHDKVLFESKTEIPNDCQLALEECAKEIKK